MRRGGPLLKRRPGRSYDRLAGLLSVWAGSLAAASGGCGPQWHFDFESAERQARNQHRPILILYKDPLDVKSSQLQDLLEKAPASTLLRDKVLCMLVTEFPPNRRYVAQYGVLQPPALVLIHPDGTYHARNGPATLQQVEGFFAGAQPPGAQPSINPQIPRSIDYSWEGIYEDAVERARQQNRELLIVYKWWLSADSTELITVFESRPEVARHFADTVNCLLDMDYQPNQRHVRAYGVTEVPAVILVHRDGTYHAHAGPMTADQIVRFVSSAKTPGRTPQGRFADQRRARAGYQWYSDLNRAQAHARNRGVNLFVFYNSLYSDQSNRMARLLDRSDVSSLFEGTINCRLDFSVPTNRQLMSQYRVDRAPAFLIVRPDGSYHSRVGVVTRADLVDLLRAAGTVGQSPGRVSGS